jgi:hypothetical protein
MQADRVSGRTVHVWMRRDLRPDADEIDVPEPARSDDPLDQAMAHIRWAGGRVRRWTRPR